MAKKELSHPLNRPGPLFVDTTCIDCGTCFHLAPAIFRENEDVSIVAFQPQSLNEWGQAKAAIISCPTNSIGVQSPPAEFKLAEEHLPKLISNGVYYCGYTARASFGASAYLICRPEGNVLVDSPKFHPQLVKKIEELGGIAWMILTHRDDVADHVQYAQHFKCSRVIHHLEVENATMACEIILEGEGEWDFADDLKILFTPGHTQGHLCLLYKNDFLFSGDHLFYSNEHGKVYANKSVCWYSWKTQIESLKKLLNYNFSWVMPGHGGWIHKEADSNRKDLNEFIINSSSSVSSSIA